MTEIGALKKSRAVVKGSMTRLVTYANNVNENTLLEELKIRLSKAEELMSQFFQLEENIFKLDDAEPSDMEDFEQNYYFAVTCFRTWIRKINLADETTRFTTGADQTTLNNSRIIQSDIKLPKINIPAFSGDYTKWQSFYDLFSTMIHENNSITPVQKFQYLKTFLTGEAESLINHLSVTEANYIEAFQKLCQRYDHKKYTANIYIKTFLDQPSIKIANDTNIRNLLDTSDEAIRGLKALGNNAESRDLWLIYHLLHKLDEESQRLWSQASASTEFPSLNAFFKFLGRRADALQTLKMCRKQQPTTRYSNVKGMVATTPDQCSLCNNEDHPLFSCPTFIGMTIDNRRALIKTQNRCYNCLSKTHPVYRCLSRRRCQNCRRKHHTMLHTDSENTTTADADLPANITSQTAVTPSSLNDNEDTVSTYFSGNGCINDQCENTATVDCLISSKTIAQVLLPTALVMVQNKVGTFIECCALLDSGSQASFVTEALVQQLQIPRRNARITISGMGQSDAGQSRGITSVILSSKNCMQNPIKIDALIVPKLTSKLPTTEINKSEWVHLKNLELADPRFSVPKAIDIIIGADYFFNMLTSGKIIGDHDHPIAQNTVFGWVIAGSSGKQLAGNISQITTNQISIEENIDKSLRKFWELEEVQSVNNRSSEEKLCEEHFVKSTLRLAEGRFSVKLPFKTANRDLGDSRKIAYLRLQSMERRFIKDSEFRKLYIEFMQEYERLGHMKKLAQEEVDRHLGYYLPHHGVLKASSTTTKLRVVFDASAKTTKNTSLNQELLIGPVVQQTLYSILIRFRKHRFVLTGDIEKMYRQILVDSSDVHFQRIFWRTNTANPVEVYELLTVTYGTCCAPFLATRVVHQLALDASTKYPEAGRAIKEDIYVDDLMTAATNENALLELKATISELLLTAGFNMRKWMSNSSKIIKICQEDDDTPVKSIDEKLSDVKILGIQWNPIEDNFRFTVKLEEEVIATKRKILSEASRIFDPLGWLSPSIVRVKIFLQNLWLLKLEWDEELPTSHRLKWIDIRSGLLELEAISIPRWLNTTIEPIEIHGFCDASSMAYAAVLFARVKCKDNIYRTTLITSKTKVAPIKQLSIPRLELCGAVLLSRLIDVVKQSLNVKVTQTIAWTDSTIVLDWLSSHPNRWTTFVGNRTSEILQSLPRTSWRHIKSGDNPADCASRGLQPNMLAQHTLWWNGPEWMKLNEMNWPEEVARETTTDEEVRHNKIECLKISTQDDVPFIELIAERFSCYFKFLKTFTYINRFINNSRLRKEQRHKLKLSSRCEELEKAELVIIKKLQETYFHQELSNLKNKHQVQRDSLLKKLHPFIDEENVIRVGGRIENSLAKFETKHPAVLPAKGIIIELLLRYIHVKHKHAGASLLISICRQQFWIIRCKTIVNKIIHSCVTCCRHRGRTEQQLMADLPACRVQLVYPFLKVGIDYAGPFSVLQTRRRGQRSHKAYVCMFVCTSTRAVHIELANDMTTEGFMAALRRFVARRGLCSDIFCDNGSNFIGARNEFNEFFKNLVKDQHLISDFLLSNRIDWHFNPPSAPHFGGLFEAAIKSMKFHLRRVIGQTILTIDEMTTLITEIEAMLNSRPICGINNNDADILTPGHFILGRPLVSVPEKNLIEENVPPLARWKLLQQISQHFWRRWHVEYLTSLQERNKWLGLKVNLKIDDIVLIKDDNQPPLRWPMGKVIDLHHGSDKNVRVVTVKTSTGTMLRPIHKLIPQANISDISTAYINLLPKKKFFSLQ